MYSQATIRNQSPTNTMLSKWEQSNVTIIHLFKCLAVMKHLRAMTILKPFVDSRFHYLCDYQELDTLLTIPNESKDNSGSNPNRPQINLPSLGRREDNARLQQRRLVNNQFNVDATNLRDGQCLLPNKKINDKLNVNNQQLIPSQTPSQFKSSISAIASTINAYDDNLPYEEIRAATNNFDRANQIGSGGFGIVYKGFWKGVCLCGFFK